MPIDLKKVALTLEFKALLAIETSIYKTVLREAKENGATVLLETPLIVDIRMFDDCSLRYALESLKLNHAST